MWTYFRSDDVEFGVSDNVLGAQLRPHVHDVVQVMVVSEKSRWVTLGTATVCVEASCALIIPAGVVHVAREGCWRGFNAYIPPDRFPNPTARILRFQTLPRWTGDMRESWQGRDCEALLAFLCEGTPVWDDPNVVPFNFSTADWDSWPISREGRIRRYRRTVGISPYAHRKAEQLNQARRRLAQGESIASVAADLGFTDQAHLGRQFKASYGTSPGRYSNG